MKSGACRRTCGATSRWCPVDSVAGRALMAVIAILTFLAALSAGAAVLAARASEQWRGAVANEMTIQIRPDSRRDMEADLSRRSRWRRRRQHRERCASCPRRNRTSCSSPGSARGSISSNCRCRG
jgi:cell division transport system permease protein